MEKLFYDQKKEVYYYVYGEEIPTCNSCGKDLEDNCFYFTDWKYKPRKVKDVKKNHLVCSNCTNKPELSGYIQEKKHCLVVSQLPLKLMKQLILVPDNPPSLAQSKGNISVFQVEEIMKGSEAEIIDNTRLAGKQDYQGIEDYEKAQLQFQKREEELSKPIEVDDFFSNLKSSKLIGKDDKEVLEIEDNTA